MKKSRTDIFETFSRLGPFRDFFQTVWGSSTAGDFFQTFLGFWARRARETPAARGTVRNASIVFFTCNSLKMRFFSGDLEGEERIRINEKYFRGVIFVIACYGGALGTAQLAHEVASLLSFNLLQSRHQGHFQEEFPNLTELMHIPISSEVVASERTRINTIFGPQPHQAQPPPPKLIEFIHFDGVPMKIQGQGPKPTPPPSSVILRLSGKCRDNRPSNFGGGRRGCGVPHMACHCIFKFSDPISTSDVACSVSL